MNTLTRETRESDRGQTKQFIMAPAGVTEISDGYTLEIEMPGVKKDGLEISVENNELTIIGRRSLPTAEGTLIHRESRPENFRRRFELIPSITATKIRRKIDQASLRWPRRKAEPVKPRRSVFRKPIRIVEVLRPRAPMLAAFFVAVGRRISLLCLANARVRR